MRRCFAAPLAAALALAGAPATAQRPQARNFAPEQLKTGAEIYERNCSPCHGARMLDAQGASDLRKFPHNERERFIASVVGGKNQMPAWGGMLKPEDIEALWAYVVSAESVYSH